MALSRTRDRGTPLRHLVNIKHLNRNRVARDEDVGPEVRKSPRNAASVTTDTGHAELKASENAKRGRLISW